MAVHGSPITPAAPAPRARATGLVRWLSLALFASTLAVYVSTLAPGVLGGDVGELQFVPHILGLPHPTGTPLFLLVGKLWTMLPLASSVARRMNLLSAVAAGLVLVVVSRTLSRPLPGLLAALSLAFAPTFWEQATMADKYAFNALMVALVLYFAVRWAETASPSALNGLALSFGLSLAHHRTNVLFAPALLALAWWHTRPILPRVRALSREDGRRLLHLAALLLLPLLLYLYLPWAEARNLPPGTWHPRSLEDWYHYIMDTGQIGYVYVDPADLGERLVFYARTLQGDVGWLGVALGLCGLASLLRRRPAIGLFLLVIAGLEAFLAANHHVPRHWVYFIPSFLIFALWIGEGGEALAGAAGRLLPRLPILRPLLLAAAILAVLAPMPARYEAFRTAHEGAGTLDIWRQTLKQGRMAERIGQAIAAVDHDAIILGDWEQATPLWYYQQVEGWRPDVQVIYPVERLAEAAATGQPLYLARTAPGLADTWHPSNAGPLIALQPAPNSELPEGISPIGLRLGNTFELAGCRAEGTQFRPPAVVPLTLYWRALEAPGYDYSVSLRFLDGAGQELLRVDSQHPVLGTYPTSRWTAGEVVGDYYEIQLPADLAAGTYRWGVILYRTLPDGGWENLEVAGTGQELALGGTIEVLPR